MDSLSVRVDDLVKDGAKRRRLSDLQILDKFINTNKPASKRSRPPSDQFQIDLPTPHCVAAPLR